MPVNTLFDGQVEVEYGQFYVQPAIASAQGVIADFSDPMRDAFRDQANGICGAARAGSLFLMTGIHSGAVHVTVQLMGSEPPRDDAWEEVVECAFSHGRGQIFLSEWAGTRDVPLDLPHGDYRVRYAARGMLADWLVDEDSPQQEYLLQFWPSARGQDEIVRVTGECATYWHAELGKGA